MPMSLEDAQGELDKFSNLVHDIVQIGNEDRSKVTEEFNERIKPLMENANVVSKSLSWYFKEHSKRRHESEYKRVHARFVVSMKDYQKAHARVQQHRQSICDRILLQDVNLSEGDLEEAKENEAIALHIAKSADEVAGICKDLLIVSERQGEDIDQVAENVENISITIGKTVTELEQAAILQKESRRKAMYITILAVLVVVVISIPVISSFTDLIQI